jgi:transposase
MIHHQIWGWIMARGLKISEAMTATELRHWARDCGNGRTAARAYAIADALDGLDRAAAARLAGMDRQALRDAVTRYNVEGVAGLFDRAKGHKGEWLDEAERIKLKEVVLKGPTPDEDGVCTWTCEALAIWISAAFGKTIHPRSMGRILRRLKLSRQKARPVHPKTDPEARERFQKGGCATNC